MQFEHNQFDNLLDDETTEDLNTETQEEVIEPAGNSTEEEEEDSSSSEEGTEETGEEDDLDAFSSFLKSRGIRDGKTIIYENEETGETEEVDFGTLSKDEQLSILESLTDPGLSEDEIETINLLRKTNSSFQDIITYYQQQAIDEYKAKNSSQETYTIDSYSDEELYLADQKAKFPEMTEEELIGKLEMIQRMKSESNILELKSAEKGCPQHLYDSLSSFSNQDEGGIIIFGIDEKQDYKEVGVYDPQDIQKKINEQCLQMEPIVRPLLTVVQKDGKAFVSAEIPGVDLTDRPVFYKGKGRLKGSYTRVGDGDEPMTEYEVYSYEAYRKKYQDDIRGVQRATLSSLNKEKLALYIDLLKSGKPNLSNMDDESIYELMSVTRNNEITLSATMIFSPYPQAYFPQLCITAIAVPGTEIGCIGDSGERFLDNQRIEGSISEMLDEAISFVKRNMKNKTIINPETGVREDRTDYPITAVREAIVNALVHRDYSIHTEGMPIQIIMYEDRMEIKNPGGIYGRIKVDQLGKMQPDTRNPVLALALETLRITENRYSGIPTIRREMEKFHLREPEFADERGSFTVTFYKAGNISKAEPEPEEANNLLVFCRTPRTRKEICEYLGLSSVTYAIQTHVMPLVASGKIKMTNPEKPKSPKQLFYSE